MTTAREQLHAMKVINVRAFVPGTRRALIRGNWMARS
jgi:hypothetical protein